MVKVSECCKNTYDTRSYDENMCSYYVCEACNKRCNLIDQPTMTKEITWNPKIAVGRNGATLEGQTSLDFAKNLVSTNKAVEALEKVKKFCELSGCGFEESNYTYVRYDGDRESLENELDRLIAEYKLAEENKWHKTVSEVEEWAESLHKKGK